MNITTNSTMNEVMNQPKESPGMQLAELREKRGFTQEYVAGKLHLRVRIIELLEQDNYELLPEPVFIKGYIRAYAKLLNVPYEPFLIFYNRLNIADRKVEKALWQGRRETNFKEKMVRWLSFMAVVVIIIAAAFWWQKSKDTKLSTNTPEKINTKKAQNTAVDTEQMTALSKIQSLFIEKPKLEKVEIERG